MKSRNFLLLIAGYGLGQGSMFMAQSWLVAHSHLRQLADFGIAFYSVTLATQIVDWGGATILSRETAHHSAAEQESSYLIWADYWTMSLVRLLVAIPVAITLVVYTAHSPSMFVRNYAAYAGAAVLISAMNLGGILDGLRLSGLSGVCASIPFAFSGAALIWTSGMPANSAGSILGGALSIGYGLSTIAQWFSLRMAGRQVEFAKPRYSFAWTFTRQGFSALLVGIPGQLYFRAQLGLSQKFLGHEATAGFLYAKQVVTSFLQVIGFTRRIEFPDLVRDFARRGMLLTTDVLSAQRLSLLLATAGTLCCIMFGLVLERFSHGSVEIAARTTEIYSITIVSAALAAAYAQGLVATKLYHVTAIVMIGAIATAGLASYALVQPLNVAAFAAADLIANLLTIAAAQIALTLAARRGGRATEHPPSTRRIKHARP